jgi:hypothetical protein
MKPFIAPDYGANMALIDYPHSLRVPRLTEHAVLK